MDPHYMQTAIIGCTGETVHALQNADTFDTRMMLTICVPRFAGDIPFQTCRIPDFDRFIVRGRYEEHVIRGYSQPSDRF
jgi:hypothetical protein